MILISLTLRVPNIYPLMRPLTKQKLRSIYVLNDLMPQNGINPTVSTDKNLINTSNWTSVRGPVGFLPTLWGIL